MRALANALDGAAVPVELFFRDDDAGWEDARLLELIARFAEHGLPVDLAVIPAELDEPFGLLPELPVHLDVARLTPSELDERFARHVGDGGPVGVMFHHGVMEPDDLAHASELLALLAAHPSVAPRTMAALCP